MYYDDEARRFNFVSGLLLGAVLGTGLALLAAPQARKRKSPRRIRNSAATLRKRTGEGLDDARDRASKAAGSAFKRVRSTTERVSR